MSAAEYKYRSPRGRHGVTLAELCIVLALLAVVTVMVTSFCLIARSYTFKVAADTDVKLSICNIEDALRLWISSVDSRDYKITIEDGGRVLKAVPVLGIEDVYSGENPDLPEEPEESLSPENFEEVWSLYLDLDNSCLVGSMPVGSDENAFLYVPGSDERKKILNYEMPRVTSLTFGVYDTDPSYTGPCFVYCSVTYEKPGSTADEPAYENIILRRAARVAEYSAGG